MAHLPETPRLGLQSRGQDVVHGRRDVGERSLIDPLRPREPHLRERAPGVMVQDCNGRSGRGDEDPPHQGAETLRVDPDETDEQKQSRDESDGRRQWGAWDWIEDGVDC